VPTRTPEIRLVVFDWAGTTIDFGCQAPTGAFVAAFSARGVAVTPAEARAPMGLHKKDHVREMLRNPAVAAKWRAAAGRDWAEADVEELYRDVTPRQLQAVDLCSALIPGVRECVAELRARGIKIAGTTGYFREAAAAVLAAGRRQGYEPDFAICADDVPAGRPAPWMIFRAMEALGVYPPAVVIKIGDTVIDIEDGRNAGAWSVGVVDSSNEMGLTEAEFAALSPAECDARRAAVRERFSAAGAHVILDSLVGVPALIDYFNTRISRGKRP
jgi:phosphonoacetaldehyde hydrolase